MKLHLFHSWWPEGFVGGRLVWCCGKCGERKGEK